MFPDCHRGLPVSMSQPSASFFLWKNRLPDKMLNSSNIREVKKMPSPVCRSGSEVSLPFESSNNAWRGSL